MNKSLEQKLYGTEPPVKECASNPKDAAFYDRQTGGCECTSKYDCPFQSSETVNQTEEDGSVNILAKCTRYQVKK